VKVQLPLENKMISILLHYTKIPESGNGRFWDFSVLGQEDENLQRQTAKGEAPAEHFPQSGPSRLNEAAQGGRCDK